MLSKKVKSDADLPIEFRKTCPNRVYKIYEDKWYCAKDCSEVCNYVDKEMISDKCCYTDITDPDLSLTDKLNSVHRIAVLTDVNRLYEAFDSKKRLAETKYIRSRFLVILTLLVITQIATAFLLRSVVNKNDLLTKAVIQLQEEVLITE